MIRGGRGGVGLVNSFFGVMWGRIDVIYSSFPFFCSVFCLVFAFATNKNEQKNAILAQKSLKIGKIKKFFRAPI